VKPRDIFSMFVFQKVHMIVKELDVRCGILEERISLTAQGPPLIPAFKLTRYS
jgi:hypothetical protein